MRFISSLIVLAATISCLGAQAADDETTATIPADNYAGHFGGGGARGGGGVAPRGGGFAPRGGGAIAPRGGGYAPRGGGGFAPRGGGYVPRGGIGYGRGGVGYGRGGYYGPGYGRGGYIGGRGWGPGYPGYYPVYPVYPGYPGYGGAAVVQCSAVDMGGLQFAAQGFDVNLVQQQALAACYTQSNNGCQLAGCY